MPEFIKTYISVCAAWRIFPVCFFFSFSVLSQNPILISAPDSKLGIDGWTFSLGKEFPPGAEGNLWIADKAGENNCGAVCLQGNFSNGGNYVAMMKHFTPPLDIKNMLVKVKSADLSDIIIRLTDNTGQVHQQKVPLKNTDEWQVVAVEDCAGKIPMVSWGGAQDKKWHKPAKAVSIIIDKGSVKYYPFKKKASLLIEKIDLGLQQ